MDQREDKRYLILGVVGALFMMLGDLTLSVISPCDTDQGLFLRQAYFDGEYPAWRLIVLFLTGVVGVFGYWYGLQAMHDSIDAKCVRTRKCFKICGMLFCFSGLAIHFGIGMGAYLTSYMAGEYGVAAAVKMAEDYAGRVLPGFYILYLPIGGIFLIHLIMLICGKTRYSRRMLLFAPILWMGIFGLIPDIRQAAGSHLMTFDYVCTQCSGNAAPLIYFLACLLLPDSFKYRAAR